MGLAEKIPKILEHANRYLDFNQFNLRLYRVLEGQLKDEVEKSMAREILSTSALNRALQRIPSINILKKTTDVLSKAYVQEPTRFADNSTDQDIMRAITKSGNLNNKMKDANRLYNSQNMFAIEPYIDEGKHKFRVLGAHQFLPYNDDPMDPLKVTAMIKFMGLEKVRKGQVVDQNGNLVSKPEIREVPIYAIYTDEEFIVTDSLGNIHADKMPSGPDGQPTMKNPFGRVPFVYGSKSNLQLIPFPNQEGFDISILIPKIIADLNYSVQFLSHSIFWSKNTDLTGQEINPDTIVDLGEGNGEGGDPELNVITPKVDITNAIKLAEFQLESYFSSNGIKISAQGSMANGRAASALAMALDQADTTSSRIDQIDFFRNIEEQLWDLVSDMQKVWSANGMVEEKRTFTKNFADEFKIVFPEPRPIKTRRQEIEEVQLLRDMKLMSRKQALKALKPDLSDKAINAWIKELDDEAEEALDKMMMGVNISPERTAAGTFNEGNQAAANQTETSKDTTKQDERASRTGNQDRDGSKESN